MVSTFYALCKLADFSEVKETTEEEEEQEVEKGLKVKASVRNFRVEPNIQVNIGINIAADTPDEKIKVIFENMKKYLLTKDND